MKPGTNIDPREAAPLGPEEQFDSATKSRHILVVEDDSGVRKMLAHLLRGAGYRVSCAEDGEAGWEAFCAENFDALITDHEMPRLTGLELLRRVRATPRQVPVILISGRMPVGEADLPQLLSPGLAMHKPFSASEFMAKVRGVLTPSAVVNEWNDEESRQGTGMPLATSRPQGGASLPG